VMQSWPPEVSTLMAQQRFSHRSALIYTHTGRGLQKRYMTIRSMRVIALQRYNTKTFDSFL
jgi:hypothetical protein